MAKSAWNISRASEVAFFASISRSLEVWFGLDRYCSQYVSTVEGELDMVRSFGIELEEREMR